MPAVGGSGASTSFPAGGVANAAMPVMDAAMAGAGAGAAAGGGIGGAAASETLGFATGGAQDVENFRTNLEAGYLPLPTDLTYEGLAKDYYFDTSSCVALEGWAALGSRIHSCKLPHQMLACMLRLVWVACSPANGAEMQQAACGLASLVPPPPALHTPTASPLHARACSNATKPCTKLFCPLYSVGLSPDPLLGTPASSEFYMAVGLDSGGWAGRGGDACGGRRRGGRGRRRPGVPSRVCS